MTLEDLFVLLDEAHRLTGHAEYVVAGSLSILGISEHTPVPEDMALSNDVDAYTKADPGRAADLAGPLGDRSAFYNQHHFYFDPITPQLLTLPEGWESRMQTVSRGSLKAWFLEPNDAAISKYARSEPRDLRWIRAGIGAGIVSLPAIRSRLMDTPFLDTHEEARVRAQIDADAQWFQVLAGRPPPRSRR